MASRRQKSIQKTIGRSNYLLTDFPFICCLVFHVFFLICDCIAPTLCRYKSIDYRSRGGLAGRYFLKGASVMRRNVSLVLVWLLMVCVPAGAQTLGTITGDVKDASGAVIPGASVTAQNTSTNATREMQSNEAGAYTFAALPPGPYIVRVELQGFRTVQQGVELHVEATVRVNFTMEIGTLAETTEVTGVAPLITTENATVGTVIENRRIVELPLNGRNFLSLVALSPNVSAEFAGAGQAGDRQGGSRANQQLSISGQRREFNYYTLDGTDNTDVNFNTYILLPSVDALEEFKVQT
ncbi:MAG: carboxypeptidase regulatory-like domain-containing protein, partial [Acidobacteria bacterium]